MLCCFHSLRTEICAWAQRHRAMQARKEKVTFLRQMSMKIAEERNQYTVEVSAFLLPKRQMKDNSKLLKQRGVTALNFLFEPPQILIKL